MAFEFSIYQYIVLPICNIKISKLEISTPQDTNLLLQHKKKKRDEERAPLRYH